MRRSAACRLAVIVLLAAAWAKGVSAQVTFTDVTQTAGVGSSLLGTDAAWGDYDNDGDLDLYVTNWGTALGVPYNHLFRNNGDGTFSDVASAAGVSCNLNSSSCTWADYDNDGDLDLYVTNWFEQDILFRNNGDGTFTNVTAEANLDVKRIGKKMEAAWADYDLDGYLDLYLGKYYAVNELYHNNRDGTFTEVADIAGVADVRDTDGILWIDANDDGYPDLLVVNREQDNSFYLNNGNGTFSEVSDTMGLGAVAIGKSCVGLDYNLDGLPDIFAVNIGTNQLFRNLGFPQGFVDSSIPSGVKTLGSERIHFDAVSADFDGDSDPDLYVVSGGESENGEINRLFLNDGGVFSDATAVAFASAGNPLDFSTAACVGDYNGDYYPDIYVVNYRENRLLRGDVPGATYLKIRLEGGAGSGGLANSQALGAVVYLYLAGTQTLAARVEVASIGEVLIGIKDGQKYDLAVRFPTGGGPESKGKIVDKNDLPELGDFDASGGSRTFTISESDDKVD